MRKILLFTLALLALSVPAAAQMRVADAVVTTAVVERTPVDSVSSYPASAERLYCFSRIVGAEGETAVTHVWYRGEQEMARIVLPVRSPDWRTWSSKSLHPDWKGEWRVEILDAQGNLLSEVRFTLF